MAYLPPDQVPPGTSPATRTAIIDMIRASQQIVPVAGETERNQVLAAWEAATGAPVSETNPCWVTRADTGALERNRGNQWEIVGGRGVPFAMAAGEVSVAADPGNPGVGSVRVNFAPGMFTATPMVTISAVSTAGTMVNAQYTDRSSTGFTAILVRNSTVQTTLTWIAVQMTP